MLVSLKSVLGIAEAKNIAVGAFNLTTLEGIRAVIGAADNERSRLLHCMIEKLMGIICPE